MVSNLSQVSKSTLVIAHGADRIGRVATNHRHGKVGGPPQKKPTITIVVSAAEDNFCKVFFSIRRMTNQVIADYDDVSYLSNPAVPIKAIAKKYNIKILRVKPERINFLHAILNDSDKKHVVIKLNKEDSEAEQRFSIAHEMGHYFRTRDTLLKKADVFKDSKTKKDAVLEKTSKLFSLLHSEVFAARSSLSSYKDVIQYMEKCEDAKFVAGYMTETVSENLGKEVSIKQAYKEWAKALIEGTISKKIARGSGRYNGKNKTSGKSSDVKNKEELVLTLINMLYEEELADYFAASLLVPLERFQLWEEKSDRTIAKAFKVSTSCIRKRKHEAEAEQGYLSKYLSSGGKT